jgi:NAD(P)-dependent dehydrogenase (short-subunit alcohol dehydrogenase family)
VTAPTEDTARADDEVVVVVAAGPGLGLAVARRFARAGATIGLIARSTDRLAELVDALRSEGATVGGAASDVADPVALRQAFATLRDLVGDPTVLVFNASEYVEGAPAEVSYDAFMHGVYVGVGAALVSVQEVVPAMRAAGRGTLLLTGSVAAEKPSVSAATVGVAKAALRNLGLSLHAELAPDGIQAVTVTIRGVLQGAKALDVDEIADYYVALHTQPRAYWTPEVSYPPPPVGK